MSFSISSSFFSFLFASMFASVFAFTSFSPPGLNIFGRCAYNFLIWLSFNHPWRFFTPACIVVILRCLVVSALYPSWTAKSLCPIRISTKLPSFFINHSLVTFCLPSNEELWRIVITSLIDDLPDPCWWENINLSLVITRSSISPSRKILPFSTITPSFFNVGSMWSSRSLSATFLLLYKFWIFSSILPSVVFSNRISASFSALLCTSIPPLVVVLNLLRRRATCLFPILSPFPRALPGLLNTTPVVSVNFTV